VDLRIKDKDFQFRQTDELNLDIEALELPISEHIEEMRQRSLQVLCFAFLAIGVMFLKITPIVELLEAPIEGIKFIQLSPGEYFLSTVKISFYGGLLFSVPFLLSQLIFYILPGLTKSEKKYNFTDFSNIISIILCWAFICVLRINTSGIKFFYWL